MVATASQCAIPPVVWWVRRDMRLDDNPALQAALATGAPLIPVFVWSPEDDGQFQQGRYSRWWTKHTVAKFQHQLEQHGSRLILRRASETTRGLLQVVTETGAAAVFFNTLYDPISLVRDHEVKRALSKLNITCHNFNADVLYEPWEVLDSNKQPYTSFESFWKGVLTMPRPPPLPLPAPAHLPPVDPQLFSVDVKDLDWFMTPEQEASSDQLKFKWRPGLEGAVEKMESFLGGRLPGYHRDRAKVDRASTSMLSPWIHTGTLSVRYLFYRVCARQGELAQSGCEGASESTGGFLQQLGYREYSRYLTFHFPFIHERALLAHLRACPWRMDQQHFKAWRQGLTGYPLVDAAMRELWSTGWTHNRMRVVTASFMVKNLLLPWQWGLKHFWDAQMDADLECDALGWQYVSGGMADAKPFSYMMDLEKEAFRFDPDGEYVRRWLPVLSRLPTQYIHAPWTAPVQVLVAADVELGFSYPVRIITMEESRMNLARACQVLDSCAATNSGTCTGGSGGHPYRAPTVPLGPSGKAGGSGSGQPGTGTGTVYQPQGGSSWPQEGQHGQGQGSNALQQQTARPVAGAAAAEAGGAGWQGGPRVQQWPRVQQLRGVEEAASHHKAPKLPKAERARLREEERVRRSRGGVALGRANEWDLAGEEEEAEEGDEELGRVRMDAETAISSSGSDDMSDEEMESEEVVSNTVGLSAFQPSGYSALPPGTLEEGEEISCRQQHPGGPTIPHQHHALSRYAAAAGATTVPTSKGYQQQQQQQVSEAQTESCAGQQPPAQLQQQPKQQQQQQLSYPQTESGVHQSPPPVPQQQQQQPEVALADAATGSGTCVDRAPDLNPHRQPQYKYQQQLHQLEQEMEVRPPQYQYNHQQSMQQEQQRLYQQMQGQQSGQQSAVGKPQMPPLPPMPQQQQLQQQQHDQQQQWRRGAEASVGNKRQRSEVATELGSGNCSEDVAYQQDS